MTASETARRLRGSLTALVTPFKDGAFDEAAFRALIAWQIESGTSGLVPTGTTGESATLSHAEHDRVIAVCIDEARGRIPVVAGVGSNATAEAVTLAKNAEKAGADALLSVVPYYVRPSQEGMYRHFKAVNDAVGIPIIIYNIPPRSAADMSVGTMARLFELENIAGVKDSTGNVGRVSLQRQAMGPDFIQLSGEDALALAHMANGGHGCISVTSNVAPGLCAEFQGACLSGDFAAARRVHDRLLPLHTALFLEPNPAPAKHALARLGRMSSDVRLPMVPAGPETGAKVDEALRHAGLLNA